MIVLGIESSCDETAVAVLDYGSDNKIIFEAVSSQIDLHALYGGVVPELAAREHLKNLPLLFGAAQKVITEKNLSPDLLAVTRGPGLKGCLLIGLEFAKGLAVGRKLSLIGVNHIEGHIHAARLDNPDMPYPFLALVVSGGHTEIIYVKKFGVYEVISRTQDDAAGEAFDKSANLLGFEYPGGAALAALADTVNKTRFELPKVMQKSESFSFSGLKTAISLLIKKNPDCLTNQELKAEVAYAIQKSIVEALVSKLKMAAQRLEVKAITATGGVACNRRLRQRLQQEFDLPLYLPEPKHCVDNAAMIALVGAERFVSAADHVNNYELETLARWSVETIA